MKKSGIDKRKYARLALKTKINVSAIDSESKNPRSQRLNATGKNIGVHGLLFTTDKKLKSGTIVTLEIFLPEKNEPIYIEGEVRWCTLKKSLKKPAKKTAKPRYDIGINFLTIDESHIMLILKYVCGDMSE